MFLGDISFIFMNHHIYSTWHLLGYQHTYPIPMSTACWNIIFIKCCLCKRKDTKVGVDYIAVCAFPSAWSFINRSKQKWFFTSITKTLMHLWIINSWLAQGNFIGNFIGWRIWVKDCTSYSFWQVVLMELRNWQIWLGRVW